MGRHSLSRIPRRPFCRIRRCTFTLLAGSCLWSRPLAPGDELVPGSRPTDAYVAVFAGLSQHQSAHLSVHGTAASGEDVEIDRRLPLGDSPATAFRLGEWGSFGHPNLGFAVELTYSGGTSSLVTIHQLSLSALALGRLPLLTSGRGPGLRFDLYGGGLLSVTYPGLGAVRQNLPESSDHAWDPSGGIGCGWLVGVSFQVGRVTVLAERRQAVYMLSVPRGWVDHRMDQMLLGLAYRY